MKINYQGVLSSLALKAAKTDNISDLKGFAATASLVAERVKREAKDSLINLYNSYRELASAIWEKIDKIEEYENA